MFTHKDRVLMLGSEEAAKDYEQERREESVDQAAEQHSGQLRFAERLAHRYNGRLLHVHGIGWHQWDGTRWAPDRDGAAVRAVTDTLKAAFADMPGLGDQERKKLLRDIAKCESANGADGVLRLASCLEPFAVAVDRINPDPHLFNTPAGTHDLRTGQMRKHDPADRITKVSGAGPYDGDSPEFTRFIERVLPDPDVRGFVQRLLGSALSGVVRDHVLPIWTGEGANGKSTLENIVRAAYGDYAIHVDPRLLLAQRFDAHTTEKTDLMGVRLAFAHETNQGRELDAAGVKALTGGDAIRARRMRENTVEFVPSHTLVMVTNYLPNVPADDPALWRRLHVVPFSVVIPEAERDGDLPDKLQRELGGITTWLLDGYRQYAEHGLTPPASVTDATDAYKAGSDVLARFLDEHCERGGLLVEAAAPLHRRYRDWCQGTGELPIPASEFKIAMVRRGFEHKKTSQGFIYQGIALKDDLAATL